jgi:predicted aspartyl protease
MLLPVSVDGTPAMQFILDTGAPLTLVDPTRFTNIGAQNGAGQVATLDVGSVHVENVEIVAASPCGAMTCAGARAAGLLGGNVLIDFAVTIDYGQATAAFNSVAPTIAGTLPVIVPFALQGGGLSNVPGFTDPVTVPPTRIAVDVAIEGTVYPFVLDTGSSAVVLRPELYDSLVADGRPQSSIDVSTVSGTKNEPTTTLRTVALSTAAQSNIAAVRSPVDLDVLSREVGHTIQGLLGGSYLSRYLVTLDYPGRQLALRGGQ